MPDLKTLCLIAYGCIYFTAGVWYVHHLNRKEIEPSPAMWFAFAAGTAMYLGSLILASRWDIYSGIPAVVDALYCGTMFRHVVKKVGTHVTLEPFEKCYIVATLMVVLFWIILLLRVGVAEGSFVTNIAVQIVISAGYFPTAQKIITRRENIEPFVPWLLALLAAAVGLCPTIASGKGLAIGSTIRAFFFLTAMLIIMFVFRKRKTA